MLSSSSRLAVFALAFGAVAAVVLSSCSLVLDANEPQCRADSDCAARGAPAARCVASYCVIDDLGTAGAGGGGGGGAGGAPILDPRWACLGTVKTPAASAATIHVRLPLLDFISRDPRAGITVRACKRLDVSCSNPIGAAAVTDADGVATIEIPAQPPFDGFYQVDGTNQVLPSLVFAQPLVTTEGTTLSAVLTFEPAKYRALVEAGGNVWNEARGHLFVQSRNCADAEADGVAYAIPKQEPDTIRVYLRDGVPDRNAPDTDATGIGGFILCGEGFHTVTGTLTASSSLVNERRVFVRPSSVTYTVMSPAP